MDAETKGLLERAQAATDDDFLSDYGVSGLIRELAATITRLTAERDEARAECERLIATAIRNLAPKESDDARG